MQVIPVEIETVSPLSIAQRRGVDNVLRTLEYLPGSTWRGALAQAYVEQGWQAEDEFKNLFVEEKAVFCDLLLEGGQHIPLTASTCKYHGGFHASDSENHGVFDIVIPFLRHECWGVPLPEEVQSCNKNGNLHQRFSCSETPMEPFRGFYSSEPMRRITVDKVLIGHTQIDDLSHTAKHETLYMLEVIQQRQKFSGYIQLLSDYSTPRLNQMLTAGATIWIGSDKSRGLGLAKLRRSPTTGASTKERTKELTNALDIFNRRIRRDLDGQQIESVRSDLVIFPVTLLSRAIVVDGFLRGKPLLEPEDFYDSYDSNCWKAWKLIRAWNATCPVDGWNSLTRFPKLSETAIVPGSVFVYAASLNEILKDDLIDALINLEQNGVGYRRAEGFGQIRVCDSFHSEAAK